MSSTQEPREPIDEGEVAAQQLLREINEPEEDKFHEAVLGFAVLIVAIVVIALGSIWAFEWTMDSVTDGRANRINAACGDDVLVGWTMQEKTIMVQCERREDPRANARIDGEGGYPQWSEGYLLHGDYVVAVEP